MSVGNPQVEENTPVVSKPIETTSAPAEAATPAVAGTTTTEPVTETVNEQPEFTLGTTAGTEAANDEAVVQATPASDGILGYKAPGLLKQFRYVKHFFWFSEEPLTQEALDSYIKSEKAEIAHHNAAWAQETGKGVLFFAKRAEDKATPSGMILLPEAAYVTKTGITDFSFKIGNHTHKFEAPTSGERDAWVVAIEKVVQNSKDLKADVTSRESYKKTIEGYSFSPVIAGSATGPTKHETPKKSLDATSATAGPSTAVETPKADASSQSSSDEEKKAKKAEKAAAKKERSQSRKRNSVFGLFGKKDEEKKEKEHEKEVKKAEKEHIKEEKKVEAEHKKEEAKAEHDASKAKEAAEAAAVAAAPAAIATSAAKKEDHNVAEKPEEVTTPTEKKNKRVSVFGGFFGKNKVTSPTTEKPEADIAPVIPAKDDTHAVSETAPKLDEPIDTKPLDTAAMTGPVDNAETPSIPAAAATEETKSVEPTSTVTPKTEKKSFLAGFMKKDKKEEPKHEKTNGEAVEEVNPIASTTAEPTTVAETTTDSPVKEVDVAKEERPAREKRRTSLFGSLGTLKRKSDKSPEPSSVATPDDVRSPETSKREKSPMPSKLGGLFRKPSRATKTDQPAEGLKTDATTTDATKSADTPAATETPTNATIVEPKGDSVIVGDVVPDQLHSTVHDIVTVKPEDVKTTT